jgi:ubiquinone/menaquinone biosynthesis C-methylase UbiE
VDSGDPWNPNPTTVNNVMKMLECIHRVLKPEGIFVSITFGQVREILIVQMRLPLISFTTIIHVGFI